MRKYFYTNGIEKLGPFSIEELKLEKLTRETKVWYYGIKDWILLSEVEELKAFYNSIPPSLEYLNTAKAGDNKKQEKQIPSRITPRKLRIGLMILGILFVFILLALGTNKNRNERNLYLEISGSSYDADIDFNFYVDKFYRDIGVYGLFPKRPTLQIIKFAKFENIDNATKFHGISYGSNDDNKIEIYINPYTWKSFNKPLRYYLIYHELAHDVLNVPDLEDLQTNKGKLMYPAITSYESITMDDFIESSHALFEEISAKK